MTQEEKSRLTRAISELLKLRLPEDAEDYPTRVSQKVLGVIERHNEQIRRIANDLIDIER